MNRPVQLLAGLIVLGLSAPLEAQSVDVGRGDVAVTVPTGYDPDAPAPLIVSLHGYTGNGEQHAEYFGMRRLADDYGFLFIAPNGTREPEGDENPFWNASDACCDLYRTGVDDVGYIVGLIDAVAERWAVDPERVYLAGHSNGGFMAYRVAYEHPGRIAAIASLAGAARRMDAPPAAPVHVLQIHGTADDVIEYGGGEIQEISYPGARASAGLWARWNGCDRRARGRESRDLDASLPGHETGALVYIARCALGGHVALWTISGGGHTPPLSETFGAQVVEWLLAHPKPESRGVATRR